ncbi:hypothetical protein FQR65_LT04362 [Abscondita terminalis]|nr:hypothetical protein FQR65_LT04362 [Abscondita terminalis]
MFILAIAGFYTNTSRRDSEPFMWENTSQWYQQCTDASSSSSNLVINASFLQNVTANNSLADNNSSGSELTTFKTNNNSPSPSDFDTNSEQCFHTNKESNYTEQKRESKIKKVKPPKKKLGKIWEFIKTLLLEECTDLVQWTDYKNGEFRLVQNRKVAQLWGERSNNPTMNYEKFSRALRYV